MRAAAQGVGDRPGRDDRATPGWGPLLRPTLALLVGAVLGLAPLPDLAAQEGSGTPSPDAGTEAGPDQERVVALVGGMLLDGHEAPPVHRAAVLIRGDRIVAAGPAADVEVPADARVIDTRGRTMLPGLIDLHVHFDLLGHGSYRRWYEFLDETDRLREAMELSSRQMLHAGVTMALDLGAPLALLEVRRDVRQGRIPGPRILTSGPWISRVPLGSLPSGYQNVVETPEEAARAARRQLDAGVDVIKTWVGVTEEDLEAVVQVAREHDTKVHAHLYEPDAVRRALRAGVDVLHHMGSGGTAPYPEEIVQEIAHRDLPVVQTIAHRSWIYPATLAFPERLDDPELEESLPPEIHRELQRSFENFRRLSYFEDAPRQVRYREASAGQFIDANAVMGVGSDAASPLNFHTEAMWREMEALVESGMTPLQVISAATKTNAEILDRGEELGTIEPGKLADVIVVDGNPLADIRALDDVTHVLKGGAVVFRGHR